MRKIWFAGGSLIRPNTQACLVPRTQSCRGFGKGVELRRKPDLPGSPSFWSEGSGLLVSWTTSRAGCGGKFRFRPRPAHKASRRSIGITSGKNGVDMEHSRLTMRGHEDSPVPNPDPVVTFQITGQRSHARVKEWLVRLLEVPKGFYCASAIAFVELEVLSLGRRLDLNPPAHRASFP